MNDVIIDSLATFRVARLVVEDVIFDEVRDQVVSRLKLAGHTKIAFAVTCPWCASMYVGAGVVVARKVAPRVWGPVAAALAFSAVAGLLSDR